MENNAGVISLHIIKRDFSPPSLSLLYNYRWDLGVYSFVIDHLKRPDPHKCLWCGKPLFILTLMYINKYALIGEFS